MFSKISIVAIDIEGKRFYAVRKKLFKYKRYLNLYTSHRSRHWEKLTFTDLQSFGCLTDDYNIAVRELKSLTKTTFRVIEIELTELEKEILGKS